MPSILHASIAASSVLICMILAEIVLRVLSPIPSEDLLPFPYNYNRLDRIVGSGRYLRFDHELGWTIAPNQARRSDGQVFVTNSAAMRADRDYPLEAHEGVRRIAAFGDSFTYCAEVTQADCWVPRLERAWPGSEILNFGVLAYGPDQAWLRYQRDGLPYHPCGVLIGYFADDIDRVVNRFRPFISPNDSVMFGKPRYLLDGDGLRLLANPVTDPRQLGDPRWVEANLGDHDAWYFPGTFVEQPLDSLWLVRLARTAVYQQQRAGLMRTVDEYPLYREDQEAYQVTARVLVGFAEQVRHQGATPVVVVFPSQRDLQSSSSRPPPYRPLLARLSDEGIPIVDLMDVLAGEVSRSGIDNTFEPHGHYVGALHGIIASYLASVVPGLVAGTCG